MDQMFRVVSTNTQTQFEIHRRIEESWANILRVNANGILVDCLQSKAKKSRKAVAANLILLSSERQPELFYQNIVVGLNLVRRVLLRHTLITNPNEHPGTLRSSLPRKWADSQPL